MKNTLLAIHYLVRHTIYWLLFFALMRIVFMAVNFARTGAATMACLAQSMTVGLVFDISIVGYVSVFYCALMLTIGLVVGVRPVLRVANGISGTLLCILLILMPANAVVYSYWGAHFGADSLHLIFSGEALSSVPTWVPVAYFVLMVALCWLCIVSFRRFTYPCTHADIDRPSSAAQRIVLGLTVIVVAGLMVIGIRGGTGIAPLNTGRAYFSSNVFANHAALNPVWNFLYSLKRIDAQNAHYDFMPQAEAEQRFDDLMAEADSVHQIVSVQRPNVVVILLESFSAHGIKYLGGENATPCLDSLLAESVAFDNVMAASDRSGKGLVATMCGYQVLPTINAIQYPQKTQTMPFVARTLRDNGYASQTFVYGGDLGFNCFNSLVTLAGFDNVIDENAFDASQKGDKWGAHDEYAFDRLLAECDKQTEPFFDFFFTLSSHEPYTVPMERKMDDDYLNSMAYTDMCLGRWIREAKTRPWWQNTIVVLIADHGHAGPAQVDYTDRRRFNIPLIFTGGALAERGTVRHTYGSQTDLAATLLSQLGIDHSQFRFSKDLFAQRGNGFAFFDYGDGYGLINDSVHTVFDNTARRYLRHEMPQGADSIMAKAYLQVIGHDYQSR